jgi:hypothetical protein
LEQLLPLSVLALGALFKLIAKRILFFGDEQMEIRFSSPFESDSDLWKVEVSLDFPDRQDTFFAIGGDAMDALLNAFVVARRQLEAEPKRWIRFPKCDDDWHWLPVIPPPLGFSFDLIIREAIDREHENFCTSRKKNEEVRGSEENKGVTQEKSEKLKPG